eukprot:jgi/Mesen1/4160/ME000219S03286
MAPRGTSKLLPLQHLFSAALNGIGNTFSIKPQQITFVVPTKLDFTAADIVGFLAGVDAVQLLYMGQEPAHVYAAHRMLASDRVYFKRRKSKNGPPLFEPRPAAQLAGPGGGDAVDQCRDYTWQVEELRAKAEVEAEAARIMQSFVSSVRAALLKPREKKPPPASWQEDPVAGPRIAAIRSFALEEKEPYDERLARESLEAVGVSQLPGAALDFLVRLGVLPLHLNMELLKSDIPVDFPGRVLQAAEELLRAPPPDIDEALRVDLTHLKVYTIDSEDTVEARRRCTSIYMCTGVIPMFPLSLAAGPMSLRQGERSCAMSVAVTLHSDGSLDEVEVMNSYVRPTYRLTFEDVEEMLSVAEAEEPELAQLARVAELRNTYRRDLGSVEINMPETVLKVEDAHLDAPRIYAGASDQNTMPRRLVSELMILCGEATARFGSQRGMPLPYRGQVAPSLPSAEELEEIPAGPCTALALRRCMTRGEVSCGAPISHASLALTGYVQFTSPIRRYGDLAAHFQVKALLRGEKLPFPTGLLESVVSQVALRAKLAHRHEAAALKYWLYEHLRRQGRAATHRALMLGWGRNDTSLASVLLLDYGFETMMRMTRDVRLGDVLSVSAAEADPRREHLRLEEVQAPQQNAQNVPNEQSAQSVSSALLAAAALLQSADPAAAQQQADGGEAQLATSAPAGVAPGVAPLGAAGESESGSDGPSDKTSTTSQLDGAGSALALGGWGDSDADTLSTQVSDEADNGSVGVSSVSSDDGFEADGFLEDDLSGNLNGTLNGNGAASDKESPDGVGTHEAKGGARNVLEAEGSRLEGG